VIAEPHVAYGRFPAATACCRSLGLLGIQLSARVVLRRPCVRVPCGDAPLVLRGRRRSRDGQWSVVVLLSEQGLKLFAQPQFWLIPPAFSVLVAAHINRNRLSESSLTTIRYICVMIIYLSSAGEMFMKLVVPDAPEDWLRPIILASLAVGGIFAGSCSASARFCTWVPASLLAIDRGHGVECGPISPAHVALVGVWHRPGPGNSGGLWRVREASARNPNADRSAAGNGTRNTQSVRVTPGMAIG